MKPEDICRIDPKCWVCGVFTMLSPPYVYEPLRCKNHQERKKFVFTRSDYVW